MHGRSGTAAIGADWRLMDEPMPHPDAAPAGAACRISLPQAAASLTP